MKNVYRSIQINSIEELDLSNLGLHFTSSPNYLHNGGGSNGGTPAKKYTAKIEVSKKYSINKDATAESNLNYPKEKEVVLMPNQALSGKLVIIENESGRFFYEGKYWGHQGKDISINTGTRCDEWVKNF